MLSPRHRPHWVLVRARAVRDWPLRDLPLIVRWAWILDGHDRVTRLWPRHRRLTQQPRRRGTAGYDVGGALRKAQHATSTPDEKQSS